MQRGAIASRGVYVYVYALYRASNASRYVIARARARDGQRMQERCARAVKVRDIQTINDDYITQLSSTGPVAGEEG